MARLINNASISGTYNSEPVSDTTQLIVDLSPLAITKEANKSLWLDTDPLIYTIVVENVDPSDPADTVEDIIFTDNIDITKVTLDTSNITVNGSTIYETTDFTYDATTGLLTINSIDDLVPGGSATISFQVTKN